MMEVCSIIHKCTIHSEKNYMNLDFSSPLSSTIFVTTPFQHDRAKQPYVIVYVFRIVAKLSSVHYTVQ